MDGLFRRLVLLAALRCRYRLSTTKQPFTVALAFFEIHMSQETLIIYCIISFFYIISPGPAVFLAIYNGAVNGFRAVLSSAFGNIVGLLVLSTLSISGLSAILLASSALFLTVKVLGAGYLIYLGVKQILAAKRDRAELKQDTLDSDRSLFSFFKEGFIIAVTNPKPIVFFAALFPQFLEIGRPIFGQFFVMTLAFMFFSYISLSTYGYLAGQAKRFLSKKNNIKWFHRISGGLFIGMGSSLLYVKGSS